MKMIHDLPFYNEKHEAIFLGWLKDVSPATIPFDMILNEKDLVVDKLGHFLGVNDVKKYIENLAALDACMYSDWFRIEEDNTLLLCLDEQEAERFKDYQAFTKNKCLFADYRIEQFYRDCRIYFQQIFGIDLSRKIYNPLLFFHSLSENKVSFNNANDCLIRIGSGDKILFLYVNMWNSSPYRGISPDFLANILVPIMPDKSHAISMWRYERNIQIDSFCDVLLNRVSGIMIFEKKNGRFSLSYQKGFMRSEDNYRDRYSTMNQYFSMPYNPTATFY